jgi:hypothetical protein
VATYPREAWQRLGELLVSRRVELDVRFRNRRTFAASVDLDYRVLYDIESTRRDNFTKSTLRAVEHAYRLTPGSLDRTLAGGPLEPADATTEEPAAPERVVVEIPEDASPAEVAGLDAIQAILDAQRQEIRALSERQKQYEKDMAELKRQFGRGDEHGDGGSESGQRKLA